MTLLNRIHETCKVVSYEPGSNEADLKKLHIFSDTELPEDYIELVRLMTEVEILINDTVYIRIWGPLGCIEMNEEYEIQKYIPDSIAIGDNEGGSALIIMTGKKGKGLYLVEFGNLDVEDAKFLTSSISDILIYGRGIEPLS